MGCRPSSLFCHSSKDWKTSGTAQRYGRLRTQHLHGLVVILRRRSAESAKPVRLMTESTSASEAPFA